MFVSIEVFTLYLVSILAGRTVEFQDVCQIIWPPDSRSGPNLRDMPLPAKLFR